MGMQFSKLGQRIYDTMCKVPFSEPVAKCGALVIQLLDETEQGKMPLHELVAAFELASSQTGIQPVHANDAIGWLKAQGWILLKPLHIGKDRAVLVILQNPPVPPS